MFEEVIANDLNHLLMVCGNIEISKKRKKTSSMNEIRKIDITFLQYGREPDFNK